MTSRNIPQEMNHDQVKSLLRFIDDTQDEAVKEELFGRLGRDCFYSRRLDSWIAGYRGDLEAFLDWVNVKKGSRYWERLEPAADGRTLVLTGKEVDGCACAFADCGDPPTSLCRHCCRRMQEELFGLLLGRKVEVRVTEAFLLGDKRCSTEIVLA